MCPSGTLSVLLQFGNSSAKIFRTAPCYPCDVGWGGVLAPPPFHGFTVGGCVFLVFLIVLIRALLIVLIFAKYHFLQISSIWSMFLFSVLLIPALTSNISFLQLILGLTCSLFQVQVEVCFKEECLGQGMALHVCVSKKGPLPLAAQERAQEKSSWRGVASTGSGLPVTLRGQPVPYSFKNLLECFLPSFWPPLFLRTLLKVTQLWSCPSS